MARSRGMGRRKIEIKKIENKDSMYSTFTKRRNGLFTKARKLAALSGANVAAIVFSPNNKLYTYGQPSVNSVVDRFLGEQEQPMHGRDSGDFLGAKQEQEQERAVAGGRESSGFLSSDEQIHDLELHELEQCKGFMEELMRKVADRLDETVMRRVCLKDFLCMNST
jgi:pheromone receptor transcription factor